MTRLTTELNGIRRRLTDARRVLRREASIPDDWRVLTQGTCKGLHDVLDELAEKVKP